MRTFQGVYDVTDFVGSHPGGNKILMAAGGAIEPFWALYAQHKTAEVAEILEGLRIGNLDPADIVEVKQVCTCSGLTIRILLFYAFPFPPPFHCA